MRVQAAHGHITPPKAGEQPGCQSAEKPVTFCHAVVQGKKDLVNSCHQNSVMIRPPEERPKVFFTSGRFAGSQAPFPRPDAASTLRGAVTSTTQQGVDSNGSQSQDTVAPGHTRNRLNVHHASQMILPRASASWDTLGFLLLPVPWLVASSLGCPAHRPRPLEGTLVPREMRWTYEIIDVKNSSEVGRNYIWDIWANLAAHVKIWTDYTRDTGEGQSMAASKMDEIHNLWYNLTENDLSAGIRILARL
ncbi:uncharacterized protein N7515_008692 [Penicillium bovifimosum]|uniref:Uncharacterized protein n=1 Tax=Penicillium bovifimosum TaxID=126998 RepID=A0A9W9GNS0_9EURO|nr:uncharacterized protein N7515_008692 [Penicillium bovifimosum]KAJ5124867.1 hypothetical protein N7515_008692 [Penicillium bovifimosum]